MLANSGGRGVFAACGEAVLGKSLAPPFFSWDLYSRVADQLFVDLPLWVRNLGGLVCTHGDSKNREIS